MKRFMVFFIRIICGLFYKKDYLVGRLFLEDHFSYGWKMALKYIFPQKILRINGKVPWPCSPLVKIGQWENIVFDPDDIDNFVSPATYYQGIDAKIYIGKGTKIAPGVGIITANHSLDDLEVNASGTNVVIGEKCWIGMNAVILPGVTLGRNTVVGAGTVVTKSFEEGNCIIAGNPARLVRKI